MQEVASQPKRRGRPPKLVASSASFNTTSSSTEGTYLYKIVLYFSGNIQYNSFFLRNHTRKFFISQETYKIVLYFLGNIQDSSLFLRKHTGQSIISQTFINIQYDLYLFRKYATGSLPAKTMWSSTEVGSELSIIQHNFFKHRRYIFIQDSSLFLRKHTRQSFISQETYKIVLYCLGNIHDSSLLRVYLFFFINLLLLSINN